MMSVFVNSRPPAGIGWDIWRGVIGSSYLAAAVFNSVYTLPRSSELDEYAEGALVRFPPGLHVERVHAER
jgi:hypothetical protein